MKSVKSSALVRSRRQPSNNNTTSTLPWISPLTSRKPTPSPPPSPTTTNNNDKKNTITHASLISHLSRIPSFPETAFEAFHRASLQPGFSHNHSTFSALLLSLSRTTDDVNRLLPALNTFLRLLLLHPCRLQEPLLLSLMSLYSRLNLPLRTLHCFHLIPTLLRSPPSPRALSTCLHLLLLRHSRPDLARSLLLHRHHSTPLNTCVHNILLKYHCQRNDLPKAFDILHKMRTSSSLARPNLITYTTLMGALGAAGRLRDAYHLFDEMIDRDRLFPDPVTYNVFIVGFCRAGMPDKARRVLDFMRTNGCEPNLFNYSALMDGLCKKGRLHDARQVFDEMRRGSKREEATDVVSYTTLMGCLCRMRRTDEAMELVREMREKGCRPDAVVANVVLEGLCGEGRFAEAVAVLDGEVPSLEGARLNKASYRIVINSLCKGGEINMAVGLLGMMLRRGVLPHHATSNGLLVALCDAGMVADATAALFGLSGSGFSPAVETWERLVDGVCKEKMKAGVFQMLVHLDGVGG